VTKWTFDRETQHITPRPSGTNGAASDTTAASFRPTVLMGRVAALLQHQPGATRNDIRAELQAA
jgi:hypothetical protein